MKNIFFAAAWSVLFVIAGCKTNTHVLKCPEIFSAKPHHETWVKAQQNRAHHATPKANERNNTVTAGEKSAVATASREDSSVQIKIPRIAISKLNENELQSANEALVKYSNNKVQLERKENGKIYLKADSRKDFFSLAKALVALKKTDPSALAAGGGGGGIALAAGIIGIVAIVFALGPFISYGAFLLGLLAIILGAIGLHSSRRGWAILGIVLGVLAIVFAGVLGIGVYTLVLHI